MKRIAVMAFVALMLPALSVPAGATRSPKTYSGTYNATAPGACGLKTCAYYYDCKDAKSGCALVELERPTYNVRIEVEDQTAMPVLARVYTLGGDGPIAKECTSPGEPFTINVNGATELLVHIVSGLCEDNTMSTPTSGVVRATRV
jgi:hypothetical protein